MNMPKTAIAIGTLLVMQGIGFYIGTDSRSVTALIPAFVGLPILAMGILAFKESARMHAMHVAAALGALGRSCSACPRCALIDSMSPTAMRPTISVQSASSTASCSAVGTAVAEGVLARLVG